MKCITDAVINKNVIFKSSSGYTSSGHTRWKTRASRPRQQEAF